MAHSQPNASSVQKMLEDPQHQFVIYADHSHWDAANEAYFFSDKNLDDLKRAGIHKIALEVPNDQIEKLLNGSLSKDDFLRGQKYNDSLSAKFDGILKAKEKGFIIKGVDVELSLENFVRDRYTKFIENGAAEGHPSINELGKEIRKLESSPALEDRQKAKQMRSEYSNDFEADRQIKEYVDSYGNRMAFDPKVAETIKDFAGKDRVAVLIGCDHVFGRHKNIAVSLGMDNSLLITSDGENQPSGKLSDILPSRHCDPDGHCELRPPHKGYAPLKINQVTEGIHHYERLPVTHIDASDLTDGSSAKVRLESAQVIFESSMRLARKGGGLGPN